MAPAFQFSYMKGLLPLMIEKTEQTLMKSSEEELFDVSKWMSLFTVDVLGLAGFGVDFKALEESDNEYYTAYTAMLAYSHSTFRSRLAILSPLLERLPLPRVTKARKAKETLQAMTRDVAEQRRKVVNEGGEKTFLLDMMLEAHPPLSDKEIQTNIFLFFLAGHETTSSALTWALHLLAEHQGSLATHT
jgi:cytochrome P450